MADFRYPQGAVGANGPYFDLFLIDEDPFKLIKAAAGAGPRFVVIIIAQRSAPAAFADVYCARFIIPDKSLVTSRVTGRTYRIGRFNHMGIGFHGEADAVLIKQR